MKTLKRLTVALAIAAVALLTVALVVTPANGVETQTLTVDGVEYESTKSSGPVFHYETPDTNPEVAFTERNVWEGNGSENLPCEGGIHWIDNKNVLTISNCLPTTTTTTSTTTTTTTQPTTTTTEPTTTTTEITTTTSSTTTTTDPTTTTTISSTTSTTVLPTTTVPPTTTTTIPVLPVTGAALGLLAIVAGLMLLTGTTMVRLSQKGK